MFRLEHGEADRSTLKKALPTLSHIQEAQSAWKDDFALNSMLRKRFRVSRAPAQSQDPGQAGVAWHHQQCSEEIKKQAETQVQPTPYHILAIGRSFHPRFPHSPPHPHITAPTEASSPAATIKHVAPSPGDSGPHSRLSKGRNPQAGAQVSPDTPPWPGQAEAQEGTDQLLTYFMGPLSCPETKSIV